MEMWARWAHRALWHESLWCWHESHHLPREGAFEKNDWFAVTNAAPAIALLAYGFFTPGLGASLCFGAGLGITIFGMAYMFVHDGLVHKRFPTGPIGQARAPGAHATPSWPKTHVLSVVARVLIARFILFLFARPSPQVPYLKRVAAAHQLHHSEKYNGVPWVRWPGHPWQICS